MGFNSGFKGLMYTCIQRICFGCTCRSYWTLSVLSLTQEKAVDLHSVGRVP